MELDKINFWKDMKNRPKVGKRLKHTKEIQGKNRNEKEKKNIS